MTSSKFFFGISIGAVIILAVYAVYGRPRSAAEFPLAFPRPPEISPFQPDDIPQPQPIEPEPLGDTRSWGERFRSPDIPEIPGVAWQTYSDKEHGFSLEYPVGWKISYSKDQGSETTSLMFFVGPPNILEGDQVLIVEINKGVLPDVLVWMDPGWAERINKFGFIPDVTLKGRDVFIRHPERNSQQTELFLSFEKDDFVYEFVEPYGSDRRYKSTIERMIKIFRFAE